MKRKVRRFLFAPVAVALSFIMAISFYVCVVISVKLWGQYGAFFVLSFYSSIAVAVFVGRRVVARALSGTHWTASPEVRAIKQVNFLFRLASLLPPKIYNECIGDADEFLEEMQEQGASHWKIQAVALHRVGWAAAYAARPFVALLKYLSG